MVTNNKELVQEYFITISQDDYKKITEIFFVIGKDIFKYVCELEVKNNNKVKLKLLNRNFEEILKINNIKYSINTKVVNK